jgi:Chaperone of endosialidase
MKPLIKFKATTLLFIPLVLSCFALWPSAQAQAASPDVSPVPDGFYKGFNTAEGFNALLSLSTGQLNTAVGFAALKADATGSFNTAVGVQALLHNNGSSNTAVGVNALVSNTTGSFNMALGQAALANNTAGSFNTAMGFLALRSNTDGDVNVAVGNQALSRNTLGRVNVAIGSGALSSNTTGSRNTAAGGVALGFNIDGDENTAFGDAALSNNTHGFANTAIGFEALFSNTSGSANIALGEGAGSNLTGNNNIDIGAFQLGLPGDTGTIRIGNSNFQTRTFIAGIRGKTTGFANAIPVLIDSAGQLGTASSSRRFKNEIKPMDKASEAILALKPVTFHYKCDNTGTPQFGLIAEEVAKVNPDLVVRDENGEIYTVRYEAVNAMLLNEFLKEHRKVEAQEATITQLRQDFQSKLAEHQKEIKALTAGLQKVSAQIEMSKPASQMVGNDQ